MAKLNLLLNLNSYLDSTPSNNPSLNLFKWNREVQAIGVDKPQSMQFCLAPGESRALFNGTRTLTQDNTTEYELSLKAGTSSTYVLEHVSGTAPQFRTSRTTGADATTEVTVTKNGSVLTFEGTVGTPFDTSTNMVVGDYVDVGSAFSASNRGTYKIIAKTLTSFSVENVGGVAEGPVALGVDFGDELRVYSSMEVQIGDTINIFGGFSPATQGSYEITGVNDSTIEFYSTASLPSETVTTDEIAIYSQAKRLFYIETDKKLSITINGSPEGSIEPLVAGTEVKPGMMLKTQVAWSLSVTNDSLDVATIFIASVE